MRAIFLSRDGVINEQRADHVKAWEEFRFLPGTLSALRWLHLAGFHIFVVTNQPIASCGIASAQVIEDINARMALQVSLHGGHIHASAYCPHDAEEHCQCRAPRPGMLLQLAAQWHVDLSRSYLVGSTWADIAAGRAANCRCILVGAGREPEPPGPPDARQHPVDYITSDLPGAVDWIFCREGLTSPHREITIALRRPAIANWRAALALGA
jgi:D-glycero-D-manno-heptose 1,7-bisphosphate phosphatase